MALAEMNHGRRALTIAGIIVFVVALMGGLLAAAGVGGGGALAVAASRANSGADHAPVAPVAEAAAAASSSTGSASTKLPAAVKSHVEQALLTPSDLPDGWVTGTSAVAPSRTAPWSKKLAACVGVSSSLAAIKPIKVSGPDYTSADKTLAVEDSILVYPTAAEAKAAHKANANAKTPSCMNRVGSQALQSSVQHEAGSGATVGTVSIAALAPGSYEAGQTGYTVTIPLASQGRQLTISSTEIEFVHGRYVHQLTFNGNGVAFTPLLEVHLVRQTEART